MNALRQQFGAYDAAYAGRIFCIASGGECKILISDLQSERHPDLAVYPQPPPEDEDVWSTWIPEIVIEVVSTSSSRGDYQEKPEEYLRFGIKGYWIVDANQEHVLTLRRSRGRWTERTIRAGEVYQTPLLPGFRFDCAADFAAAARAPR